MIESPSEEVGFRFIHTNRQKHSQEPLHIGEVNISTQPERGKVITSLLESTLLQPKRYNIRAASKGGTSLMISSTMSSCLNVLRSLLSTILVYKNSGLCTSIWLYTRLVDSHIGRKMTKVVHSYGNLVIFHKKM